MLQLRANLAFCFTREVLHIDRSRDIGRILLKELTGIGREEGFIILEQVTVIIAIVRRTQQEALRRKRSHETTMLFYPRDITGFREFNGFGYLLQFLRYGFFIAHGSQDITFVHRRGGKEIHRAKHIQTQILRGTQHVRQFLEVGILRIDRKDQVRNIVFLS